MKSKEICSVEGCKRLITVKRHKLCNAHYLRYLRYGDVGQVKIRKRTFIPAYIPKIPQIE